MGCNGHLELPEEMLRVEFESRIREWNSKVCPASGEFKTETRSLVVMKNGDFSERPCVHRTPYLALDQPRFVLTLESMTGEDMEKERDMVMDSASENDDVAI